MASGRTRTQQATSPSVRRRPEATGRPQPRPDPGRAWLVDDPTEHPGRVVIESIEPTVDGGRFAAKRVEGDVVAVTADLFAEGHDRIAAVVCYRKQGESAWREVAMAALGNDRWRGVFTVPEVGRYEFTVSAWVDDFLTWRAGLEKKVAAGLDVATELAEGAELVAAAADRSENRDRAWLAGRARALRAAGPAEERVELALDAELLARMGTVPDRRDATTHPTVFPLDVERLRAAVGAWYEMFPRSSAPILDRHGTLVDATARVPYVAAMGFDVLYLPPIHPIGRTHRKGRNNSPQAEPSDVGSPWAIGSASGGHDAIHPDLGTLEDFDRLVQTAAEHGLEVALDIAFQCSPDHPWVREHPEWFRHRPDGTIRYAENPPKKYEDIYPLDFESPAWRELWRELERVLLFWVGHGVRIFRVDNPHTKPFAFWEWVIHAVRARHPDVVFLSEAFTRPRVLEYLAKCGFSQSYTYFTWRNTKPELVRYLTEVTTGPARDYLRPNLFANTPDILHEYLQAGGRAGHQIRLVLAATLAGSYGIYGPHFELAEAEAVPGTEEYLDSEKYQVRHWPLDRPESLAPFIARVNQIRRDNPAIRYPDRLRFLTIDHDQLVGYARSTPDLSNVLIVVVNLSPHHPHAGWLELPLAELGLDPDQPFQVHDLLGGARYLWQGPRNYVAIDPRAAPAQIFRVRRRLRTERDFDYYL